MIIFYDAMLSEGSLIFKTFEKFVELSVCHRQKLNIQFSKILDREAVGEFSDKDFQALSQWRLNILDTSEQEKSNEALFIYPTNDAVDNKNEECLTKLNKPVLNNRAIAGLHVYMFGDFRQLPPVKDAPFCNNHFNDAMSSEGSLIYKTFEKLVELSVCHRQKSDIQFLKFSIAWPLVKFLTKIF